MQPLYVSRFLFVEDADSQSVQVGARDDIDVRRMQPGETLQQLQSVAEARRHRHAGTDRAHRENMHLAAKQDSQWLGGEESVAGFEDMDEVR